jgi:hypothetical protein
MAHAPEPTTTNKKKPRSIGPTVTWFLSLCAKYGSHTEVSRSGTRLRAQHGAAAATESRSTPVGRYATGLAGTEVGWRRRQRRRWGRTILDWVADVPRLVTWASNFSFDFFIFRMDEPG